MRVVIFATSHLKVLGPIPPDARIDPWLRDYDSGSISRLAARASSLLEACREYFAPSGEDIIASAVVIQPFFAQVDPPTDRRAVGGSTFAADVRWDGCVEQCQRGNHRQVPPLESPSAVRAFGAQFTPFLRAGGRWDKKGVKTSFFGGHLLPARKNGVKWGIFSRFLAPTSDPQRLFGVLGSKRGLWGPLAGTKMHPITKVGVGNGPTDPIFGMVSIFGVKIWSLFVPEKWPKSEILADFSPAAKNIAFTAVFFPQFFCGFSVFPKNRGFRGFGENLRFSPKISRSEILINFDGSFRRNFKFCF